VPLITQPRVAPVRGTAPAVRVLPCHRGSPNRRRLNQGLGRIGLTVKSVARGLT
jgi:hypothetical protein